MDKNKEHEGANTDGASSEAIDWTTVDLSTIPDDVIKATGLYKNVLAESIQRRQTIAEMKATKTDPVTDTKKDEPKNSDENTPDLTSIVLEAVKPLADEIAALKQARDAQQLETARARAISESGLPDYLATRVSGSTYDEILADAKSLAEKLGIKSKTSDSAAGSTNPDGNTPDETSAMIKRVKDKLSAYPTSSPFAPGVHRGLGGGVVAGSKK